MGIITRSFSFLSGTVFGIYIAQNYTIPNITKIFNETFYTVKKTEEKFRKPGDGAV